ncbi:(2Fe-2S)-binding protein [Dankookia sp. P2]|uniref:(2Fe-2S)-binding protein n=1 Tax=Dankookia sp. P2 TaxID=3423955 RepID=UPI003D66F8A3
MFLCLCNALTDRQVADAIHQGARRPREVYARCGCHAQCGRCTASILNALHVGAAAPSSPSNKQDR